MREDMSAPPKLSNKRLGVRVGPGAARGMTRMRDDEPASQIMVGDELNPVAFGDSRRFLEQTDILSFIEAHAPAIRICACGRTVCSERGQRKIHCHRGATCQSQKFTHRARYLDQRQLRYTAMQAD